MYSCNYIRNRNKRLCETAYFERDEVDLHCSLWPWT